MKTNDTMSSYLDLYTTNDIAQEYGLSDNKFKEVLAKIYAIRILNDTWEPNASYLRLGYVKTICDDDKIYTYWTVAGKTFIMRILEIMWHLIRGTDNNILADEIIKNPKK